MCYACWLQIPAAPVACTQWIGSCAIHTHTHIYIYIYVYICSSLCAQQCLSLYMHIYRLYMHILGLKSIYMNHIYLFFVLIHLLACLVDAECMQMCAKKCKCILFCILITTWLLAQPEYDHDNTRAVRFFKCCTGAWKHTRLVLAISFQYTCRL